MGNGARKMENGAGKMENGAGKTGSAGKLNVQILRHRFQSCFAFSWASHFAVIYRRNSGFWFYVIFGHAQRHRSTLSSNVDVEMADPDNSVSIPPHHRLLAMLTYDN